MCVCVCLTTAPIGEKEKTRGWVGGEREGTKRRKEGRGREGSQNGERGKLEERHAYY